MEKMAYIFEGDILTIFYNEMNPPEHFSLTHFCGPVTCALLKLIVTKINRKFSINKMIFIVWPHHTPGIWLMFYQLLLAFLVHVKKSYEMHLSKCVEN